MGSQRALRTLQERIAEGDIATAAADVRSLEPFWSVARSSTFVQALEVAAGVNDPCAPTIMLKPYGVAELTTGHTCVVAALTSHYGKAWLRQLLQSWVPHSLTIVVGEQVETARREEPPARAWTALGEVGGYPAQLLTAADEAQVAAISDELAGLDGSLMPLYVSILQSAKDPGSTNFAAAAEECRNRLEAELAKPKRAED